MKRETTIANELAVIERKLSETTNKTAIDALKSKRDRLKAELKGMNMPAHTLAKKLLAERNAVKQLSKVDFNDLIRQLSKKPEYSFLKTMPKTTIKNDIERKAKPVGYRFKGRGNYDVPTKAEIKRGLKNGSVYSEKRPLRSDVSRVARLAKGGNLEDNINMRLTLPQFVYLRQIFETGNYSSASKFATVLKQNENENSETSALSEQDLRDFFNFNNSMYKNSLHTFKPEISKQELYDVKIDTITREGSEKAQQVLFDLGFSWNGNKTITDPARRRYLIIQKNGNLRFLLPSEHSKFDELDSTEIEIEELGIENPLYLQKPVKDKEYIIYRSTPNEQYKKYKIMSTDRTHIVDINFNTKKEAELFCKLNGFISSNTKKFEKGGNLDKRGEIPEISDGTLDAYFLLLREFDDDEILENSSQEELDEAKKMVKNHNFEEGEIFDWKEEDEAREYRDEMESKGYHVYEYSGGDDIRFVLFKLLKTKFEKGGNLDLMKPMKGKEYQFSQLPNTNTFILESTDGMHQVDMIFSNQSEAKIFAAKHGFKLKDIIKVGDRVKSRPEYGNVRGTVEDLLGPFAIVKTKSGKESFHISDLIKIG